MFLNIVPHHATIPQSKHSGSLATLATGQSSLSSDDSTITSDDPEAQPLVFNNKTTNWTSYWLSTRVSQGQLSVPLQRESRIWLKFLVWIPMAMLGCQLVSAYVWIPIAFENGVFQFLESSIQWTPLLILLLAIPVLLGLILDIVGEITTAIMLLRGRERRYLPENIPRLTHAVIICNYKEPLEVLRATLSSLAKNTLAQSTIVVLACEARDNQAQKTFEILEGEFALQFRSFVKTSHTLTEGEMVGKSSNENHACQELYKMVVQEGLDPFQVMVTTCDADSLFDTVFLEQVEAEYCRMPDGRRFLYNSPINTYRNLPECNFLVRAFEVLRCQFDTYSGITGFRPAQSNYSLTLGFAKDINFWDPSNTSEDFHTTLKAMAMTGLGETVIVKIWSLILNDSVAGFSDRWVQAKRHMWGVEEIAFCASLFPILHLSPWGSIMRRVTSQMLGVCTPALLYVFLSPIQQVFFSLRPETRFWLVSIYVAFGTYNWIKMILREVFLYKCILSNREWMMKRSLGEWVQLVVFWPVLSQISSLVFATAATWRMLVHAVFHETLVYVTAPKALNNGNMSRASAMNHKPQKDV